VKVLCYGSVNPDLIHHIDRFPETGDDVFSERWDMQYGGGGGNAAVALASWDAETLLLGNVVGSDPMGAWLLEMLARPHLDLSLIERDPAVRTPHCVVMIDAAGDRTIISTGYRDVPWQEIPDSAWLGVDVLLVDGYSGDAGARVAAEAGRRGVPVVGLDAGPVTARLSSLVVWSRHEHPDEAGAREVSEDGHPVVLTGGAGEVVMWWGDGTHRVAPPDIAAVDGTGAGDVFAAMAAYGLGAGWDPARLLAMAVAAGGLLAGRGRAGGIPLLREIEEAAARLDVH